MARTFPAVVINGIIESGKTRFILDSLKNGDFGDIGKVLILSQEEGEEEYDAKRLEEINAAAYVFESEEEFTVEKINELIKKHKPNAVFFEMNAMWDSEKIKFPPYIMVETAFTIIDATTFKTYFNNMRQKFADMIKASDVVILNRCEDTPEMAGYKRSLKIVNTAATYIALDKDGKTISFAEELPYKLTDEINIKDEDFGTFYIDTFDNGKRYDGKTVEFNCICAVDAGLPKNSFVAGRPAMTCCANDIQFIGHLCFYRPPINLKPNAWEHIKARVKYVEEEGFEPEIVFELITVKEIPPIDEPVVNLT